MALFRNVGVNLRDRLCDAPRYASVQCLHFLDLAKNGSFLNRKLERVPIVADCHFWMGTAMKRAFVKQKAFFL
jgi:hypothetical protein